MESSDVAVASVALAYIAERPYKNRDGSMVKGRLFDGRRDSDTDSREREREKVQRANQTLL